jgi:NADH-quinone oxidoreductase subunit I
VKPSNSPMIFELASYTREGRIWDRETLEKGPRPTEYKK